jgi:CRISPR-associated exonuclease Cas4
MIDFNKLIDQHIFREHRSKKIGRYYPSEIGSCLRKVWYSYKYPREVEPDLLKIFEVGNIMHDFVVEVLKSERTPEVELLKSEFPFKLQFEDFLVSGRVDDLILVKESGRNILVEVKSCSNISFVKKPQNHHVMQLQLYMHAIGVHNGLLLYVEKSNLQTKIFEIQYDESKSLEILERFKILHKCLTESKLPDAEAKNREDMKWMCKFCECKERCDKNEI